MGRRRKGSRMAAERPISEGRFGLARVEACLEVAADCLAVREHLVVASPARWELHDPDVVVSLAVAARVRCGLVKGAETIALSPPQHFGGHLPDGQLKRKVSACNRSHFARISTRSRACSSTGSSLVPCTRSTGAQRPTVPTQSVRGRRAGGPCSPSGRGRGTARSPPSC